MRGEYVSFDKLTVTKKKRFLQTNFQAAKEDSDRLSQLVGAWNKFAGVIVARKPARALEMLKYQTLISISGLPG